MKKDFFEFPDLNQNPAFIAALKILNRRAVSEKEMRDKLAARGFDDEDIENAVGYLLSAGYINDEQYAEYIAKNYALRGYGERRIKQKLFERGIDKDCAESTAESFAPNSDTAEELLKARLKNGMSKDDLRRASAFLARRGFSWDDINTALARVRNEFSDSDFTGNDV